MRYLRLYCIGLCMGLADLIPGISGGTVAFLSGIYEELLLSIQSLRLSAFKKIAWPFLLPLGLGIASAFLTLAPLFHYLLTHHAPSTYAFFFGVIVATTVIFLKQVKLKKVWHFLLVAVGMGVVLFLASFHPPGATEFGFFFLLLSGALASCAMLLPGISGSYVLFLLGVYPYALSALASRTHLFSLLLPLFIGIVIGLVGCARVVTFCLASFRGATLSLLTGLMIGGVGQIWPFSTPSLTFPILFALFGFLLVLGLDALSRYKLFETRFKD